MKNSSSIFINSVVCLPRVFNIGLYNNPTSQFNTSATAHNYPVDYAKTIFAKNAEFNEWIGRFICLCKLMGKTPSDYIMRGIE